MVTFGTFIKFTKTQLKVLVRVCVKELSNI